jgi:hypothetical protein
MKRCQQLPFYEFNGILSVLPCPQHDTSSNPVGSFEEKLLYRTRSIRNSLQSSWSIIILPMSQPAYRKRHIDKTSTGYMYRAIFCCTFPSKMIKSRGGQIFRATRLSYRIIPFRSSFPFTGKACYVELRFFVAI